MYTLLLKIWNYNFNMHIIENDNFEYAFEWLENKKPMKSIIEYWFMITIPMGKQSLRGQSRNIYGWLERSPAVSVLTNRKLLQLGFLFSG